jgi:hypothetical protein
MYVIIKYIPAGTTLDELENYVFPPVKGSFFQKKGQIKALKIIQLVDKTGKSIERHGLVIVNSEDIKKRVIKSLSPKSHAHKVFFDENFDVKFCSVEEYFIRHWSNDRRAGSVPQSSANDDMRIADRRRRGLHLVAQFEK